MSSSLPQSCRTSRRLRPASGGRRRTTQPHALPERTWPNIHRTLDALASDTAPQVGSERKAELTKGTLDAFAKITGDFINAIGQKVKLARSRAGPSSILR